MIFSEVDNCSGLLDFGDDNPAKITMLLLFEYSVPLNGRNMKAITDNKSEMIELS